VSSVGGRPQRTAAREKGAPLEEGRGTRPRGEGGSSVRHSRPGGDPWRHRDGLPLRTQLRRGWARSRMRFPYPFPLSHRWMVTDLPLIVGLTMRFVLIPVMK
jgi:hypothetical protein